MIEYKNSTCTTIVPLVPQCGPQCGPNADPCFIRMSVSVMIKADYSYSTWYR